jgi:hypothetical protein
MSRRHRKKKKRRRSRAAVASRQPQDPADESTGGALFHVTPNVGSLKKTPNHPKVPVSLDDRKAKARREALGGLWTGIIFTILILCAELYCNFGFVGRDLEYFGDLYRHRLMWFGRLFSEPSPVRVAIVDIGDLRPEKALGVDLEVTPRSKLLSIINAIIQCHPAAIGVDVNFAPYDKDPFLTPGDASFFDQCLKARDDAEIPLFLGLNWNDPDENRHRPIQTLLKNDQFSKLFAWILLPKATRRAPYYVDVDLDKKTYRLASMSAALANGTQHAPNRFAPWFAEFISETSFLSLQQSFNAGVFAVDYGILDELQGRQHTLKAVDPQMILHNESLFEGNIVLVGDVTHSEDPFKVDFTSDAVPGVYVHGCAANTLVNGPFYELTAFARSVIDVSIVVFALCLVTWLRWNYSDETSPQVNVPRVYAIVTFLCVIALWPTLLYFHLLWSEFVLAAIFIIFHHRLERGFHRTWHFIKWGAAKLFLQDRVKEGLQGTHQ